MTVRDVLNGVSCQKQISFLIGTPPTLRSRVAEESSENRPAIGVIII